CGGGHSHLQMTRGKSEKITAMAMASVANTLARLSMDVCLYLNQNFSFITFPDALTTGSSIMPHKKNPDVFELIRAHCNRIQALPNELSLLLTNLPSGYHRDVQLTKEILFPALTQLHACLQIAGLMLKELQVKDHLLENNTYRYIYSVEAVNERVNQGIPFRQAYQEVGDQIEKGEFTFDPQKALHHSHEGSIGNLCTQEIKSLMQVVLGKFSI
ncbi:MAG: lyase family protein, partial [Chitinophagaceae bacterium]